jgi:hypothetical protein
LISKIVEKLLYGFWPCPRDEEAEGVMFRRLIAKLANIPCILAPFKLPAKLTDRRTASKRMNIKAKSIERAGKKVFPYHL